MASSSGEGKASRVDSLTFLFARTPLAKEIEFVNGTWTKRPAPLAKHYTVSKVAVRNLDDVERRLRQAAETSAILVHGTLKPGVSPQGALRRKTHFKDVPHRWIAVDLDKLMPGPSDPAEAAEIARGLLPAEFHGAACVWEATAGHALEPGRVRLRLWFWADQPVSLAEVDAWLSACDAKPDRSIWRAVQPLYLTTHVIGGPDPVPQRWGRLPGVEMVRVPSDLAAVAKATVERVTALPAGVLPDAANMIEDFVALLRSRDAERIGRDGRHMTIYHCANDAFDRGLTEATTLAMLTAWSTADDEAEAELREVLSEASIPNAADLARTVRLNGEPLADAWSSGEPLEVDVVERMAGDALQSRTAPIGCLYRPAITIAGVPTVDEALAEVEAAAVLGLDLDAAGEGLRVAMTNDDAPESRTAAAMQVIEDLKAGADALDQLNRIVKAHGTESPAAGQDEPKPSPAIYLRDLVDRPIAPVEQIVKGVLTAAEIVIAAGAPGAGKSAGLMHLGLCVASGAEFHGRKVRQGGVLYAGTENRGEDERRVRANLKHYGREADLPFRFLPLPLRLYNEKGLRMHDEKAIVQLALEMEADTGHKCKLIIVDNLRRTIAPGSTNDEAHVTILMKSLERIRDATGAAVICIHHAIRDGSRYAGSGAIESHADSVWQFAPITKAKGSHGISFAKLRLGDKRQALRYAFAFEIVAHDTDGEPIKTVVTVDQDPTAGGLSAVEGDGQEAAELGTAPVEAVEVADGMPERIEMMGHAAREISTTRERFSAKELYAATNGMRIAVGLGKLGTTTLDMVREALIGSGALRVEGFGRARSYWVP